MYPKAAKIALSSIALIFSVALAVLLISMFLGSHKYGPTAMAIVIVLGLPLRAAYEYVADPVDRMIREIQFVDDPSLSNFVRPLLNGIDQNVRIGLYPSDDPNALAISSVFGKESAIAFSTGLVDAMSPAQLMAIAAHEVAHIKNADSLNKSYILAFHQVVNFYPAIMSYISKEILKSIVWISLLFFAVIFLLSVKTYDVAGITAAIKPALPFLTLLLRMAAPIAIAFALNRLTDMLFFHYSRQREFAADADGAAMTSTSDMKQALRLLSNNTTSKMGFFDTHPPIADRLSRL